MNLKAILLALLTIIVFSLVIFNLMWFKDGEACMINPFVYGAKEYTKANDAEMYCTCDLLGKQVEPLSFNSTHLITRRSVNIDSLNWSKVTIED